MTQQPTFQKNDFVWATYYSGFGGTQESLQRIDGVKSYRLVDSQGNYSNRSIDELKLADSSHCKAIAQFCAMERQGKQDKVDELTAELELAKAALAQN